MAYEEREMPIWTFVTTGFWKTINEDSIKIDKTQAVCKICKAGYKYIGDNTNLASHIKSHQTPDQSRNRQHNGVVNHFH